MEYSQSSMPPTIRYIHLLPEANKAELNNHLKARNSRPIDFWKPQPKQLELFRACGLEDALTGGPAKEPYARLIGYGGAAFGGKTEAALGLALTLAMTYKNVRIGVFRRTLVDLEGSDGMIQRSLNLYGEAGGTYNSTKHIWKFTNGSTIKYAYCDNEKDVYHYQSQAWDILIIDEATHFSWTMMDYILTRNRVTKETDCKYPFTVMLTNPGNIGHMWYYRTFDLKKIHGEHKTVKTVINMNDQEETIYFLPAFMEDNVIGMERDPKYEEQLRKRDPKLFQALRFGNWEVFAGQIFSEWDPRAHVIPYKDFFEIPAHWTKWRAVDWGYAAPFSCHWFAKDPDTGRIYIYREYYRAGLTDPQQARKIVELSGNEEYSFTFADPSMWASKTIGEVVTDTAEIYAQNGVYLTKADNAHPNKLRKLHVCLSKMYMGDGKPILQIFEDCKHLIQQIPMLVSDPNKPEDYADGQEEHAFDSCTYGLTNFKEPLPLIKDEEEKAPDPWARMKGM